MKIKTILETSVRFSLDESWQRNCTVLSDIPLTTTGGKLDDMTGESFLNELPELQIFQEHLTTSVN